MIEPELPEVETIRRDLERDVSGRKIKAVEVKGLKSTPHHKSKKSLTDALDGAKVVVVERHGLFIVAHLNNEHTIVVRLGDESKLVRCPSKTAVEANTQVIITFTQGGDLRFVDRKGTGEMAVVPTEELESIVPPPDERGLDLLAKPVSWVEFGRFVLNHEEPLKKLLTDDSYFVGIGNLYSDEILFDAGLRFDRKSSDLSMQELRRLNRSVVGILHDAIKYRGTTLEDRPFVDLEGNPGTYAEHLAVYGKEGELSPRSRTPILKQKFKGQVVYFCSTQV